MSLWKVESARPERTKTWLETFKVNPNLKKKGEKSSVAVRVKFGSRHCNLELTTPPFSWYYLHVTEKVNSLDLWHNLHFMKFLSAVPPPSTHTGPDQL